MGDCFRISISRVLDALSAREGGGRGYRERRLQQKITKVSVSGVSEGGQEETVALLIYTSTRRLMVKQETS